MSFKQSFSTAYNPITFSANYHPGSNSWSNTQASAQQLVGAMANAERGVHSDVAVFSGMGRYGDGPMFTTTPLPQFVGESPLAGGVSHGARYDPYFNGHGETIYTMDQFLDANKGLTRIEIINQRQDRSKSFLSSQPGGPNMRYVVNPHDGRVLDMRHMLVVGKYPVAVGNLLEVYQWTRGQASGMDRQDFYSNGVGYQFYRQYSGGLQNLFYPSTFTDQMRKFFYGPRVNINW